MGDVIVKSTSWLSLSVVLDPGKSADIMLTLHVAIPGSHLTERTGASVKVTSLFMK